MGFLCIGGKSSYVRYIHFAIHGIDRIDRISHVQSVFRKGRLLWIQGHASCEEGGCDRSHSPLEACQYDIDQSIALNIIESSLR